MWLLLVSDQDGTFYIPNENESEFSIDELGTIRLTASKLEELKSMSLNKMETDRDPFCGLLAGKL